MKLGKNVFIMIMALMLILYSAANIMLYRMSGDQYVHTDLFFLITAIFTVIIMASLPRIVSILLGFESRAPKHEIDSEC
jgi:uncharacterized membrane protein